MAARAFRARQKQIKAALYRLKQTAAYPEDVALLAQELARLRRELRRAAMEVEALDRQLAKGRAA